jgi:4-amino-4-deoxy-L-arabinose transferase-like glycosyltransferase
MLTGVTETLPLARWWREPLWAKGVLAAILAGSALLMTWNLARGGDFAFYEAAARSMSESWRALLFGAFDPAGTVTLDKLAGFAVPQALAIHVLGMSTSAVALPQVIEGLVTVMACAVVGLRWGGTGAGLVAALAAASTPIFVSMFGHPMEDGLLTMALAVALVWWQRAVLTARWWPLVMAAVFVGVGFQAKMMSAWFVLPALFVGTAIAAPTLRRGIARAGVLVGASVAASIVWITAIALTPIGARPFVDGSTDDDVFAMVFGYNGLDRFAPGSVPGSVGAPTGGGIAEGLTALGRAFGSHGGTAAAGGSSPTKLLEMPLVTQIGWLYPAALLGLALALWRFRPRRGRRNDRARWSLAVVAGLWLATSAVVLSATKVPHTAYVAALGVPLVLLTAMAWSEGCRLLRSPRRAGRLVLPVLLVGQGAWWSVLAREGDLPTVFAVAACLVLVAGVVLGVIGAWPPRPRPALARVLPAALGLALLCAPVAASLQVLDANRDGSGGDAYVGIPARSDHPDESFAISAPAFWGGTPEISPAVAQLVATARADGAVSAAPRSW